MMKAEMMRIAEGAAPRDLSAYSGWRDQADPKNVELIGIYTSYLGGQFSGMGDALSLTAVQATMEILDVPRDERPELARRLVVLHGMVREEQKVRAARA